MLLLLSCQQSPNEEQKKSRTIDPVLPDVSKKMMLRTSSSITDGLSNLIALHCETKDPIYMDRIAMIYRKMTMIEPEEPLTHLQYGMILELTGHDTEAKNQYQQAFQLCKDSLNHPEHIFSEKQKQKDIEQMCKSLNVTAEEYEKDDYKELVKEINLSIEEDRQNTMKQLEFLRLSSLILLKLENPYDRKQFKKLFDDSYGASMFQQKTFTSRKDLFQLFDFDC